MGPEIPTGIDRSNAGCFRPALTCRKVAPASDGKAQGQTVDREVLSQHPVEIRCSSVLEPKKPVRNQAIVGASWFSGHERSEATSWLAPSSLFCQPSKGIEPR